MTRFLLAIALLPLAVLVGCGDPDCVGDDCSGNVDCGDNCGDDDDSVDPGEFSATLRSVAPYGWVGDHRVRTVEDNENVSECQNVNECDALVDDFGNFRLSISGDTFECVPQVQLVTVNDDDSTINVTSLWTGAGICGLAPDGDYDGWNIHTDVDDYLTGVDQVILSMESWDATITGSSFSYEDSEYLFEGTIADDLSSITYHLVTYDENGEVYDEWNETITLED